MLGEISSHLECRALGMTGETISVVGLGTAPSGHRSEDEALSLYEACLEAGVNHIDTGPQSGGFGQAQRYLGRILKDRRKEVFLATRCYEADGEKALRQLRENLAALNTDRADLVYVQSIGDDTMPPERIFARDGVCRYLEKARADGLTRFVGVSGHNRPSRFLQALEEWRFDVMMTPVNPVCRYIYDFETRVWPAARAKGVGLLGMKVFGGVKDSGKSAKGALLPDALRPAAVHYALQQPGASGVVLGFLDRTELGQVLGWLQNPPRVTEADNVGSTCAPHELAADWGELFGPAK